MPQRALPILILQVLVFCAPAQTPLDARLDEEVSSALTASGAPSISVAVVKENHIVYAKAFGKADLASGRAADVNTRYAIGSVSKQFTAAALLWLQQRGKLSLDDKVAKFFPDLTGASEITIRELLSHTSGYEDYAPQDYIIPAWQKPTTAQQILNTWAKKPLNFRPGTQWQYSNTNYVLAAAIFEKVAGEPLLTFLKQKIFTPLGMKSAGSCQDRTPQDATAYTRYALGPARPVAREASGWYSGAAELCMTPSDLARWNIAFLERLILSPESYQEFTREVRLTDGFSTRYALGLSVGEVNSIPELSHGGEVSGFLTENRTFPTKLVAVSVCSNEDGVNLVGPLSLKIAREALEPRTVSDATLAEVRKIVEDLQQGRIDRSLLTSNANAYFTWTAIDDYHTSLAKLGKLQSVSLVSEQRRGGMKHQTYAAKFEKKSVRLNIYVTSEGKYEQFLVVEQM